VLLVSLFAAPLSAQALVVVLPLVPVLVTMLEPEQMLEAESQAEERLALRPSLLRKSRPLIGIRCCDSKVRMRSMRERTSLLIKCVSLWCPLVVSKCRSIRRSPTHSPIPHLKRRKRCATGDRDYRASEVAVSKSKEDVAERET
jgi:hypothetical protein